MYIWAKPLQKVITLTKLILTYRCHRTESGFVFIRYDMYTYTHFIYYLLVSSEDKVRVLVVGYQYFSLVCLSSYQQLFGQLTIDSVTG
jgi:hypothetical protein